MVSALYIGSYMKLRGEQQRFGEGKKKFTKYFASIGCWDHGASENVVRGCAHIGVAIDALIVHVTNNSCTLQYVNCWLQAAGGTYQGWRRLLAKKSVNK